DGDLYDPAEEQFTRAGAAVAPLQPGFTAAAAPRTRAAHRNFDRNDQSARGFAARQHQTRADEPIVFALAEKCVAHPLDDRIDTGKVDRDLVREAIVHHEQRLTIGVDPRLVKTTSAVNRGGSRNLR